MSNDSFQIMGGVAERIKKLISSIQILGGERVERSAIRSCQVAMIVRRCLSQGRYREIVYELHADVTATGHHFYFLRCYMQIRQQNEIVGEDVAVASLGEDKDSAFAFLYMLKRTRCPLHPIHLVDVVQDYREGRTKDESIWIETLADRRPYQGADAVF